jgi:hypothetical protein
MFCHNQQFAEYRYRIKLIVVNHFRLKFIIKNGVIVNTAVWGSLLGLGAAFSGTIS